MIPLWTKVILPSDEVCGWEFKSVLPPCVAHLVCAIPIVLMGYF